MFATRTACAVAPGWRVHRFGQSPKLEKASPNPIASRQRARSDWTQLGYTRLGRPMFPLDRKAAFAPARL